VQLKELKMLYMKRKERLCTLVEFLGVGRGTLGQDLFLQAVATNELVANTSSWLALLELCTSFLLSR